MTASHGFSAFYRSPWMAVTLRVTAGVGAGYVFIACWVPLLALALALAGMQRSEGVVLSAMLGFLFYLGILLWAFSVRSLARLWTTLTLASATAAGLLFLIR
jgi:hypothetical protein